MSLPTRPVVHCELVRDEAIQERVDFVHNGSVGTPKATPIIHIARTHRICPLGAYLSLDPVNKFPYIANLVTRTKGCVIQAHSESPSLKSRRDSLIEGWFCQETKKEVGGQILLDSWAIYIHGTVGP